MTTTNQPLPTITKNITRLAQLSLLSGLLAPIICVSAIAVQIALVVSNISHGILFSPTPPPTWLNILCLIPFPLAPVALISGVIALGRVGSDTEWGRVALVGVILGGLGTMVLLCMLPGLLTPAGPTNCGSGCGWP